MRASVALFIVIVVIAVCSAFFVKSGVGFISAADPLAQQMFILENSKSRDIVKIKGELMRDLISNYYKNIHNIDSLKSVK